MESFLTTKILLLWYFSGIVLMTAGQCITEIYYFKHKRTVSVDFGRLEKDEIAVFIVFTLLYSIFGLLTGILYIGLSAYEIFKEKSRRKRILEAIQKKNDDGELLRIPLAIMYESNFHE
jgi:hypothetical protein